jgi:hypothetical protein
LGHSTVVASVVDIFTIGAGVIISVGINIVVVVVVVTAEGYVSARGGPVFVNFDSEQANRF